MIETLPPAVAALWPYEPRWCEVDGYTLHYVDEGPRSTEACVLLHGNPTWGFLYRKLIPRIVAAGFRVIVPDHLGCGRSDHGRTQADYAIAAHARRLRAVLDHCGVERACLWQQDWGGPIGWGAVLDTPERLAGMVLGNTFWGVASDFHRRIRPWRGIHAPVAGQLFFASGTFLNGLRLSGPPEIHDGAEWDAYSLSHRAHGYGATLAWPRAISLGAGHPTQPLADAIWDLLPSLDVPTRFVWGGADQVFPPEEQGRALRERLPRGQEHPFVVLPEARHFVQEWAEVEGSDAMIAVAQEAFG